MNRRATTFFLVLLAAIAAGLGFRWNQQFNRLQQVEVGATPFELGTLNRMTLTNASSSRVELELRCFVGPRDGRNPSPVEKLVLLPQETREFQVYAEHTNGNLPSMLPVKHCLAVWQGPLGWERTAWRVLWLYSKPPQKQAL